MFRVYDNNKPARYPDVAVSRSWDNCDFPTLDKAKEYANLWLGDVYGPLPKGYKAGDTFWYSGYNDFIRIVEE